MASLDGHSATYEPLKQTDVLEHTAETPNPASGGLVDTRTSHAGSSLRSIINLCAVTVLGLIPLIALIVWGSLNTKRPQGWTAFSGAPIAGRLTQPQAKFIDVLCSAVLAPILMVVFNYYWFTSARVAAVNELDRRAVPLGTLALVSSSTAGAYDIPLIWQLLFKSKAPRLAALGGLVLFAAIANSALGNIIAYEAFMSNGTISTVRLQFLQDDIASKAILGQYGASSDTPYQFHDQQKASFFEQFAGMLTGMSISNARSLLNSSDYHMVNVTKASLESLSPNVLEVPSLPATKYSIKCEAVAPNVPMVQANSINTAITLFFNATTFMPFDDSLQHAYIPGPPASMQTSYNDEYTFVGFGSNASYIGFTTSFDLTNDTVTTPYGAIRPKPADMTSSGFEGTKIIMSW